MNKEVRVYNDTIGSIRVVPINETQNKFLATGLGIPINRESRDLGGFREVIMPDAITEETLQRSDVVVLYGHDSNKILGRVSNDTARFWREEDGWHYEFAIPDTTYGQDLRILLERGDIRGSSFGFTVDMRDKDAVKWEETENGYIRRVNRIHQLFEFSPVVFPAYGSDTTVALRSLNSIITEKEGYVASPSIQTFLTLKRNRHYEKH